MAQSRRSAESRLLDLTKLAPGPHCTMILGDLGAESSRSRSPGRRPAARGAGGRGRQDQAPRRIRLGRRTTRSRATRNRSGSISRAEPARRSFCGWRSGPTWWSRSSARASPSGWESITRRCRRAIRALVYCAVTGFGQTGPYRDYVGHDLNYIAHRRRALDDRAQGSAADDSAESARRLCRRRDACGDRRAGGAARAPSDRPRPVRRYRDARRHDAADRAGAFRPISPTGKIPQRGDDHDGRRRAVLQSLSRPRTARYITIGSVEPWFYANLCRALGCEEFIADENNQRQAATRSGARFTEIFKTRTRDEWFEI